MSISEVIYTCPVCGSTNQNHRQEDEHGFMVVSEPNQAIAIVINMQGHYDKDSAKARRLSSVRAQLKEYFPDKGFEIQPSRYMLTSNRSNSVLLGEGHVSAYIAYER